MSTPPPLRRLKRDEALQPFYTLYARLLLELENPGLHDVRTLQRITHKMDSVLNLGAARAAAEYWVPVEALKPLLKQAAVEVAPTRPAAILLEVMPNLEDYLD